MFESLQDKLEGALKRIRGQSKLTDENVSEALAEVRRALLDADVNLSVVKAFLETVKEKSLGLEVKPNVSPGELMIKLIHDELIELMGAKKSDLAVSSKPPTVIMVAGLQGSGKTTFCAKLAHSLKKKGKQPLLVACDIYRPAAVDQLVTMGQSIKAPVFTKEGGKPLDIAQDAMEYARKYGRDTVIVDTAGRLTIDEEMMQEVSDLKTALTPNEILFVCDSMTGQDAVTTAQAFNERLELTGVVLTKLDGDTRGGAALSIRHVLGKPIKFVGTGEKVDALEPFYPERIASRILGMGDIISLVEKAQQHVDDKEAARLEEKIKKNRFTFVDFLDQMKLIKKMGSLKDLLGMIPGMDKAMRGVELDEGAFSRVEAIVLSMTLEERNNPRLLNGSRRRRIAAGSGTSTQDVNRLIKQFEDMQKMMKKMTKGGRMPQLPGQTGPLPRGFGRN